MSISDFKPDDGGNRATNGRGATPGSPLGDPSRIQEKLLELIQNARVLETDAELKLRDHGLSVGDFDTRLQEAHAAEWPEELGDLPNYVSFPYYKTLRLKSSTSSAYIRRKFEEGARDVTGNSALDILCLADIVKKEALLIKDFLDTKGEYIGAKAEQRVLANFEIWVQSAISQTRRLYALLEKEPSTQYLTGTEASTTTPAEARRSQAVLKVSLNGLNDSLLAELNSLKRNFSDSGSIFYSDFLAPAVESYGAVSSMYGGSVTNAKAKEEAEKQSQPLLGRLNQVIDDQARRQRVFKDKLRKIARLMKERDEARGKIIALQEQGKRLPLEGRAIMRVQPLEAREVGYWREREEEASVPESQTSAVSETPDDNEIASDHSRLTNLHKDSHPQYLKKAGGEVSGDISLADGVRIDGVVPSQHRHTGADGTPQLDGRDIIPGTLPEGTIDEGDAPAVPENLRLDQFSQTVVPPGLTAIDAIVAWDGDERYNYEMQLRRLS